MEINQKAGLKKHPAEKRKQRPKLLSRNQHGDKGDGNDAAVQNLGNSKTVPQISPSHLENAKTPTFSHIPTATAATVLFFLKTKSEALNDQTRLGSEN